MLWRLLWRSSFRLELIYRWARHQSFFNTSVSIITGLQTIAIVPVINDWPLVKKDWTWPSLLSQHNHHFLSFIIKMNNWKKVIDDWLRESERKARWWRSNQAFLRASASGWSSYWLVERTLWSDLHRFLIPAIKEREGKSIVCKPWASIFDWHTIEWLSLPFFSMAVDEGIKIQHWAQTFPIFDSCRSSHQGSQLSTGRS